WARSSIGGRLLAVARGRDLPVDRLRDLLSDRAVAVVDADAAAGTLEAVHPARQLRLLCRRGSAVLFAAWRRDVAQPARGGPDRSHREAGGAQGAGDRGGSLGSDRARRVQVLLVLCPADRRRARPPAPRVAIAAADDRSAGRHQLLYVSGDLLRRRRVPRRRRSRVAGRLCDLFELLLASGGGTDRARAGGLAPARQPPRSRARRSVSRLGSDRARA